MAAKSDTTYIYNPADWAILGKTSKCELSGHLICPNEDKMAKTIFFCCKKKKNGSALWIFKGEPNDKITKPEKIKCKPRP